MGFREEFGLMTSLSDSKLLDPLEDILLFVGTLVGIDNAGSAACAIMAFVKARTKTSIFKEIEKYLTACMDELTPQAGESGQTEWSTMLRKARTDWTESVKSPMWKHLSTILGVIVATGICHASTLQFNVAGFEVVKPALLNAQKSSFDILDAVLSSLIYFAENCTACWRTKSLKPLLYGQADSFDDDYHNVLTWWELVRNGNLEKQTSHSESHFKTVLRTVGQRLKEMRDNTRGIERTLVEQKILKIAHIESDYATLKIGAGIREAPFVYELYGDSSQGKSTVMNTIDNILLASEGLDTSDDFKRNLNVNEKYYSGWRTDMLVMRLDDFCNAKASKAQNSPAEVLLRVANNVPFSAPMADVHQKGKVFVEPVLVPITTNKKDLDAASWSCNPYSIQRRGNFIITVRARDHFQRTDPESGVKCGLNAAAVAEWYQERGMTPPEIEDLWTFDIEQAVKPAKEDVLASYSLCEDAQGNKMEDIDIFELAAFLTYHFKQHRVQQAQLVARHREGQTESEKCGINGCEYVKGCCAVHDFTISKDSCLDCSSVASASTIPEDYSVDRIREIDSECFFDDSDSEPSSEFEPHVQTIEAYNKAKDLVVDHLVTDSHTMVSGVDSACAYGLLTASAFFVKWWHWSFVIPTSWYDAAWFQQFFVMTQWATLQKWWRRLTCVNISLVCAIHLYFQCNYITLIYGIFALMLQMYLSSLLRAYLIYVLKRQDYLPAIVKKYRDQNIGTIFKWAVGFTALYAGLRFFRRWRRNNNPQSFMNPSVEEVESRDATPDVYASLHKQHITYASELAKTVDKDRLMATIKKNLMHVELLGNNKRLIANVLFVKSNVFLIPRHYFEYADVFTMRFSNAHSGKVGGNFCCQLNKDKVVHLPDTDLSLAYCSTGGSFRDIIKHFPILAPTSGSRIECAWRDQDGSTKDITGTVHFCKTTNNCKHDGVSAPDFDGGQYLTLSEDTFFGMCGMPVILASTTPVVCGLHVGGKAGTPKGCFATVLQSHLKDAVSELCKPLTRANTTQDVGLHDTLGGKEYMVEGDASSTSPMRYLPHGAQLRYLGKCSGGVTSKNMVFNHIISDSVAKICDSKNVFHGPKITPRYWPWQTCLANVALPAQEFEESLLQRCALDWVLPLIKKVRSHSMWKEWSPLTEQQNINGIPGVKYIDAMKLNTSVGYPDSGKKSQHIENVDAVGDRKLTSEFREQVVAAEATLFDGDRLNVPAKACVKMEVMKKEKARIFYACPMILVYLTRKYFLPIARLMQMYPALSECAVGINAQCQEWDHLIKHATSKGKERIVAGDYSKYDQKLPAQLIMTAMNCMIRIAREMHYSERDLRIMESIASELTYPLVAFNGDLVQFMSGGWISGTAITVHVNGICGALNQRYVFFTKYPAAKSFRDHVVLLTYGDDNIGSVDADHTDFNIKSMQEELSKYGQTYTMPDKESELVEFLPEEDLEFLKRQSVFKPELGVSTGALNEESIFKSLHCRVKSKNSPLTDEEASAQNLTMALVEFFHHGSEVYERRREQLQKVAEAHRLADLVPGLGLSYSDRVSMWFFNYGTEEERFLHTEKAEIARKKCGGYVDPEFCLDINTDCDLPQGIREE